MQRFIATITGLVGMVVLAVSVSVTKTKGERFGFFAAVSRVGEHEGSVLA